MASARRRNRGAVAVPAGGVRAPRLSRAGDSERDRHLDVRRIASAPRLGPQLLSTRNLERHYGVDVIIRAFALVRNRYPEATSGRGGIRTRRAAVARAGGVAWRRGHPFRRPPGAARRWRRCTPPPTSSSMRRSSTTNRCRCSRRSRPGSRCVSTPTGDLENMIGANERGLIVPPADPDGDGRRRGLAPRRSGARRSRWCAAHGRRWRPTRGHV